ncbi:hypothetical protein [Nesterenkonia sp. PF2B19]|uniref:hypothetical protein n=1 Tax=Nesterenkonia sp. PF2B19 TaxID=1881858 RepID=UPI00111C2205|nr:hypothetical protein [Nesterenkonia sp. PF2B19]
MTETTQDPTEGDSPETPVLQLTGTPLGAEELAAVRRRRAPRHRGARGGRRRRRDRPAGPHSAAAPPSGPVGPPRHGLLAARGRTEVTR